MSRVLRLVPIIPPAALVVAVGLVGSTLERSSQIYVMNALVSVSMVVALYSFVGNTGVLSFGHMSFVAVGAWVAGVMSIPTDIKVGILPELFEPLQTTSVGNLTSLVLAAVAGGLAAALVGLPLMRLSGLAAGIATFAVLEIVHNVLRYWEKIGPGAGAFSSVPETTGLLQATIGALVVMGVAFAYQVSRRGRLARATREDPAAARAVGISVYRERLGAFILSGALAGLAGGLFIHQLVITSEDVYLGATFLTLSMLVIGGLTSLWGAVLGTFVVTGLDAFLAQAENDSVPFVPDLPSGTRLVVVALVMALVLVVRPNGLTGGRELVIRRRRGGTR
ncbi:MAG: branched-chain amino acid ABC transporter permease [Thermoleophilia bacterium]|nr:branched-chain amino acid ABC transporter permease [Thermoleophilia bacterium]